MSKRIAINGFGRIGRLTLRNLLKKENIEVVAVNDLTDNQTLAHLFKFDSSQGKFDGTVTADDDFLIINGKKIRALSERDPAKLPWKELEVDVVLECTGFFLSREKASLHFEGGAKRVVLSAPAKDADIPTIVLGANEGTYDPSQTIISNASCTTNCLSPMIKILEDNFGIVNGFMTTIHAYTSAQNIQDAPHKDLRRARAAAINMIPTTTGAAKALGRVLPASDGKISAAAIRVPVITGSITELTVNLSKEATVGQVNAAFKAQAEGAMKGILEYSTDPLVSSDIIGNQHSSIFDSQKTDVNGKTLRIMSWYDNEAGYSARMADLAEMV